LRREWLDGLLATPVLEPGFVVFVCTHNSARSQFAAARWRARTGRDADSAGTQPADRVHPGAVRSATRFGLDLSTARPQSWQALTRLPDLVVSVCDRAHEAHIPFDGPTLHWSIPDPLRDGRPAAFQRAFESIDVRLERLASATGGPGSPLVTRSSSSNPPPKGPRP
jgi:protein-tyrosine-phosphatase